MHQRVIDLLKKEASDELIVAKGWVKTKRDSKTVSFLELSDGSTLKGLQVVVELQNPDNANIVSRFQLVVQLRLKEY